MLFNNVKLLCSERGVSVWALETATEIGNGTIGKWKTSSPRIETIKKVADYFGVTVDELLAEDDSKECVRGGNR